MAEQRAPLLGEREPEVALPSAPAESLSLGDLRGGPVIVAFCPADWSPVRGDRTALYEEDGTSERASFIIAGEGLFRRIFVSPKSVNPGAIGILSALEALQPTEAAT